MREGKHPKRQIAWKPPVRIRKVSSPARTEEFPAGRMRIAEALYELLETKSFASITTAAIAKRAGVTEALIYKYFDDKRDLLHQVLGKYTAEFLSQLERDLRGIEGCQNKLRKLVWASISSYAQYPVYGRMQLLEVRNYPGYYRSRAYKSAVRYARLIRKIIEDGVASGELRDDVSPQVAQLTLIGAIEQLCLPKIIFRREILPDSLSAAVCAIFFRGIEEPRSLEDRAGRERELFDEVEGRVAK